MDSSNRKLLLFATAVGLVAAFAYSASGLVSNYEYRTDIFLGEFVADNNFQPFEPATATDFFVRDTLLIAPPTEELTKLGVREIRSSAVVTVIEAGKSLRVRSTAAEDDVARVKAVHQFIAAGILDRLKGRADYVKTKLENRLSEAQEGLEEASKSLAIFSAIASDAKASEAKALELARSLADEIALGRQQPLSSSPIDSTAMDEMRYEGIGLSRRGQLGMYQKLGFAEIPLLRADSARSVVALGQTVAQWRQASRDVTNQLAVFREPAVTQFMVRSVSPAGPAGLLLFLVALVAGFTTYFAARAIRKRLSS